MSIDLSRRELLQWAGLVTTGVVLSPTPFAAIDDLTIRTQTHGRSRKLPKGQLDRTIRHCPGCPRACALEVLTVGNAPYLCVPVRGASNAFHPGCALMPAVHQLALHPLRATSAIVRTGRGHRPVSVSQATDLLIDWIEDARRDDAFEEVALLDLSGRPPMGRPLDVLAGAMAGSLLVERDDGFGWLDECARQWGLPEDRGLGIDPTGAEVVSPLEGLALEQGFEWSQLASATGHQPLVIRPDGAGLRPHDELKALVLERSAGSNGTAFPAYHRPWPSGMHLDAIADGSLSLLLVDASRAACAIPWRRLRTKLKPGQGRLIVWASQKGVAFRMADLGLPAPAPFEIEEIVGGDRLQPRPGLAIARPLREPACPDCGPENIAARLGVQPEPASRRLARQLSEAGSGTLETAGGRSRPISDLDPTELEQALATGGVWRADPAPFEFAGSVGGPLPLPRQRAPWIAFEGRHAIAAGEPVPPLLSKITREFLTAKREGEARVHPDTLGELGLADGERRQFRTTRGTVELRVHADDAAPRGAIVATLGFGGDCFGDDPGRRRAEPLLATLDFDPQLDPPDACAVLEVM